MYSRLARAFAAILLCTLGLAGPAAAQSYPVKPIRIVVPSAPGGITDTYVRLIGDALQTAWGQPVIMDHRAGAGGVIGTDYVAKAAADGYTLLMGNIGPLIVSPLVQTKSPYDVGRDLVPVILVATFPNVLVVNPNVPARNVAELLALARQKPGALHFASSGIGQSHHLSGEVFKRMAGVDIVHVPYKGTGPALTDLLGGQVEMMFSNLPPAVPHIRAGKLRALGVTSARRAALLAEVPSIAEAGVPGFDVSSWVGLMAPAGTPREIVARLNQEIRRILREPANVERSQAQGAEIAAGTAEEFATFLQSEQRKWAPVIREANIRAE